MKIREKVLSLFPDRECINLIKPNNNDGQYQQYHELMNNQIQQEFWDQIKTLREKIIEKATLKKINGITLNMRIFLIILKGCLEEFNDLSPLNISAMYI